MDRSDKVQLAGVVGFAILIMLPGLLPIGDSLKFGFLGAGIGVLGAGLAAIALGLAHRTDVMMHAVASHDFYEKQAVLSTYAAKVENSHELSVFAWHSLLADVRAARQLSHWAPRDQRQQMKRTLDWIVERTRGRDVNEVDKDDIDALETLANHIQEGK